MEQVKAGEASASHVSSLKKLKSVSSLLLYLYGGLSETRTRTPVKAVDFESTASTKPLSSAFLNIL
jgi:hypothetical protein